MLYISMGVKMIVDILKHTPVWVWGLFAVLLYLGYFQSRPHTLAKRRVVILPAVFISLSALGVWSAFGVNPIGLAGWASGAVAALLLNRLLMLPKGVLFDAETGKFSMPGSFGPLVLMMAIFATRYAVAVVTGFDHSLLGSPMFAGAVSLAYGFLSGCFLARSLRILATARSNDGKGSGRKMGSTFASLPLAN